MKLGISDELVTGLIAETYKLAVEASRRGDQPFGALAASYSGKILNRALNSAFSEGGEGKHAEINLLNKIQNSDVSNIVIFTSTEPCRNCCEALNQVGIRTVFFGCSLEKYNNLWGKRTDGAKVDSYNFKSVGPIDEEIGLKIHQIYFEKCFPTNRYLAKWAQSYRDNSSYWGSNPSSILSHLPAVQSDSEIAVDLGCGDGRNSIELYNRGYKVTAVDNIPQAIISAQSKSADDIDYICMDALKFLEQLAPNSISVILANHILQHLSPSNVVQGFFEEVHRTLKNGGLFLGAYFIGPADIHPAYVQKFAYLPNEGVVPEKYFHTSSYNLILQDSEVKEDFHGGEHHFHYIEKLIAERKQVGVKT